MMFAIYELLLRCWIAAVQIAAIRSPKARAMREGQRDWRSKLSKLLHADKRRIWVHCASYGEYQDGRGLIELLRQHYPGHQLLFSFFSPSGYVPVHQKGTADVIYLPLDTPRNAEAFVALLNPEFAVFVRHDIWPNYLRALDVRQIPTFLTGFLLRSDSRFTGWPQRCLYRRSFAQFTRICCQDERSAARLHSTFRLDNLSVTGNPRIDTILQRRDAAEADARIRAFIGHRRCVIAGSVTRSDEPLIGGAFGDAGTSDICWIVAAHDPFAAASVEWQRKTFPQAVKLSQIHNAGAGNVLWVDSIGLLPDLYQYADLAYVGGGFSRMGIHSILEPAAWNCRICFGPNHRSYPEALDLLTAGYADIVRDADELVHVIKDSAQAPAGSESYVRSGAGAAQRCMQTISECINPAAAARTPAQ